MRRLLRARWVELLLVGGLGLSISPGFIYRPLQSAVNAGLIMSLAPIVTLIAAVTC